MSERVQKLQAEYARLSKHVRDLYRRSDNPNISGLQHREAEIVAELRAMGASPIDPVAAGRAC